MILIKDTEPSEDMKPVKWGGCYTADSPTFNRGALWGLSRTLKSIQNDASVIIEYDA